MSFTDSPDIRPLAEIPFAQTANNPAITDQVRKIYGSAGLSTAHEIIEAGCTHLVTRLRFARQPLEASSAIAAAIFVRERHDGAGFGLPCRVPSTHFCLVHNTIGGLQKGQREGTASELLVSARLLTDAEHQHVQMVDNKLQGDAAAEAKTFFGLERIDDVVPPEAEVTVVPVPKSTPLTQTQMSCADWKCPEHKTPVWKCRYCLAAMIVAGPLEPNVYIMRDGESAPLAIDQLDQQLKEARCSRLLVYTTLAVWQKQFVRVV